MSLKLIDGFFILFVTTFFLWETLFVTMVLGKIVPKKSTPDDHEPESFQLYTFELNMPSVLPQKDDEYFCTAKDISKEDLYIKKFEPNADSQKIHHIIIFGCKSVPRQKLSPNHWPCSHAQLCSGMSILYAWGRNAPSLQLPPDVGFHVGGGSPGSSHSGTEINYLILQAHYAHPLANRDSSGVRLLYTVEPQPYVAGIFILASSNGMILPRQPKSYVDVNCQLKRDPINIFAYRVHAHSLGTVITGYRYSTVQNKWQLLAKGNPQWPQAFYPMSEVIRVQSEDILHARCTYNSTMKSSLTAMGSTAGDEMCNLYLMYYQPNPLLDDSSAGMVNLRLSSSFVTYPDSDQRLNLNSCENLEFENLITRLPEGNDQPLPRNLTLEESAMNHHSHHSSASHFHSNFRSSLKSNRKLEYTVDPLWPIGQGQFGQITAVDLDQDGNLVIFHRGKHVWNQLTFDWNNNYRRVRDGPIAQPTIVTIDPKTRKILHSWGENLFFMPHGLTIDSKNHSIWLTDVAMHQVFKYSLDHIGSKTPKPLLALGKRFKPGRDNEHFCKPTSVAVDHFNGEFYVADGYCNSRIIRFNSEGKYLNHWGHEPIVSSPIPPPNSLNVPHKIILVDRTQDPDVDSPDSTGEKLACVADREHGRIQCFLTPYGQFRFQIRNPLFNGRLFSIAHCPRDDILYAVNGQSISFMETINGIEGKTSSAASPTVMGFAFDFESRQPLATFAPKNTGTFTAPHDIAVSASGREVYVVEIGPNNIWKFINSEIVEYDADQQIRSAVANDFQVSATGEQVKFVTKISSNQQQKLSETNQTTSILKSKIIEPNLDKTKSNSEKINFSFEMLQIRTKEFREKVWSNNFLYFLLVALFILILALNLHHTTQIIHFCTLILMSILSSLKSKIFSSRSGRGSSSSGERIRLNNVLKKAKNRHPNKKGFNRLPQNEEESDLVIQDDDSEEEDGSDVLEDFSLTRNHNSKDRKHNQIGNSILTRL